MSWKDVVKSGYAYIREENEAEIVTTEEDGIVSEWLLEPEEEFTLKKIGVRITLECGDMWLFSFSSRTWTCTSPGILQTYNDGTPVTDAQGVPVFSDPRKERYGDDYDLEREFAGRSDLHEILIRHRNAVQLNAF